MSDNALKTGLRNLSLLILNWHDDYIITFLISPYFSFFFFPYFLPILLSSQLMIQLRWRVRCVAQCWYTILIPFMHSWWDSKLLFFFLISQKSSLTNFLQIDSIDEPENKRQAYVWFSLTRRHVFSCLMNQIVSIRMIFERLKLWITIISLLYMMICTTHDGQL